MSRTRRGWRVAVLGAVLVGLIVAGLPALAQGGPLPLGEPVEAALADGETHAYTFRSEGGQTLSATLARVTAAGEATSLDPVLAVFDPDGRLLAYSADRARGDPDAGLAEVAILSPGVYTLLARSYGNRGAGTYRLEARLETLATLDGSAPISLGETVQAEIFAPGQVDRWSFQGEAGQVVSIGMSHAAGSQLDPLLDLIGPDGRTRFPSADDGGGVDSLIQAATLPVAGPYVIGARAWGNLSVGEYELSLAGD
jgi:hypothetical protein